MLANILLKYELYTEINIVNCMVEYILLNNINNTKSKDKILERQMVKFQSVSLAS